MEKYTKLKTKEDLDNWLKRNYTKEQMDYLQSEANNPESSLFFYYGEGYRIYNRYLRNGIENQQKDYDIVGLRNLFCSFSTVENIISYRYVDVNEFRFLCENTRMDKECEYPSFMSTTLVKKLYNVKDIMYNRILIKIYIPKGSPGIYIPDSLFANSPEYEFLLPYRIKLKRIGHKKFMIVT